MGKFKIYGDKVYAYLSFMLENEGNKGLTYAELEDQFDISFYKEKGNFAKKTWNRFLRSDKTIESYLIDCGYELSNVSNTSEDHEEEIDEENEVLDFDNKVPVTNDPKLKDNRYSYNYEKNQGQAVVYSEGAITIEQAFERMNLSPDEYECTEVQTSSWDVHMKFKIPVLDKETGKIKYYKHEAVKKTNYAYNFKFKKKGKVFENHYEDFYEDMKEYLDRIDPNMKVVNNGKVGVITLADFHIGSDIIESENQYGSTRYQYNIKILNDKLQRAAAIINSHNFKKVHINLLGDYFESLTGLNHNDSWKDMDRRMIGRTVIKVAQEVLCKFFNQIENLVEINMIAGNHDRLTKSRNDDALGEGAGILYEFLCMAVNTSGIKINYDPHKIVTIIDDIGYILTHGHTRNSKTDIAKVVAENITPAKFHLWMEGHLHTRKSKTTLKHTNKKYEDVFFTETSCQSYRKINVASLFTGNDYSDRNGWTGISGMTITTNDGTGECVHQFDYSLHESKERRMELA